MKTTTISAFLAATNPEKTAPIQRGQFVEMLIAYLPDSATLPEPLERTFNWMEDQGWFEVMGEGENFDDYHLNIYPNALLSGQRNLSQVIFRPEAFALTKNWTTPDSSINERVIPIASTSGDGGRAVIWIDDDGAQWYVHLGHNTHGTITDDPIVFLQFVAMGYLEPGALKRTDITPLDESIEYHGLEDVTGFDDQEDDDISPTLAPEALQNFLKTEFDIIIPKTAHALGISDFAEYGDKTSTDPFVKWLTAVSPAPTEAEVAYVNELADMAASINVDSIDKPRGIMSRIKGFFGGGAN